MRKVIFIVACVLLLLTFVVPSAGFGLIRNSRLEAVDAQRARLTTRQARVAGQVMAEHRRWAAHPLFQPRDGGDCAQLLLDEVGFDGKASGVPAEVRRLIQDANDDWPTLQLDAGAIDLSWLSKLSEAGYWDHESTGPLQSRPYNGVTDETFSTGEVMVVARLRLLQGLESGSLVEARAEVHELTRLCFTAESLIFNMVGLSLLNIDRKAVEEAARRGLPSGPAPLTVDEHESLRRALWASQHATALVVPPTPLHPAFPLVGRCAALNEAGFALWLRPWLHDSLPERYEAISTMLRDNPQCRLRRLRHAWATSGEGELAVTGDALCTSTLGTTSTQCNVPTVALKLPLARQAIGTTLLTIDGPDWLSRYVDAGVLGGESVGERPDAE